MKKLIAVTALGLSMLITEPAVAYEVKSGDTMSEIAKAHNLSLGEIAQLNPQIKDINLIYVGEHINTNINERVETKQTKKIVQNSQAKSTNSKTISSYEKDLLARLVRAEAQSEPYIGKVAVAEVVLNRVASNKFPDSIKGVIYQKNQFSPVTNGSINRAADSESIQAVEQAISNGNDVTNGSLYFYNPKVTNGSWLDSLTTVTKIGNHTFKK